MKRIVFDGMAVPRGKAAALRKSLAAAGIDRNLTACQAAVASVYGYSSWAELKSCVAPGAGSDMDGVSIEDAAGVLAAGLSVLPAIAWKSAEAAGLGRPRLRYEKTVLKRLLGMALSRGGRDLMVDPDLMIWVEAHGSSSQAGTATTAEMRTFAAEVGIDGESPRGVFSAVVRGEAVEGTATRVSTGDRGTAYMLRIHRFDDGLGLLGLSRIEEWRRSLASRSGIVVASGPAGSGKWTTLVASVDEAVRRRGPNCTAQPLDAPSPTSGSDVVFYGELRSTDTMRDAVARAERGHLVVATVHAGSALHALRALRLFGASKDDLRRNLRAVLCQVLVVRTCPVCGGEAEGTACVGCGGRGRGGAVPLCECASFDPPGSIDAALAGDASWPTMVEEAASMHARGEVTADELERKLRIGTDESEVFRSRLRRARDAFGADAR